MTLTTNILRACIACIILMNAACSEGNEVKNTGVQSFALREPTLNLRLLVNADSANFDAAKILTFRPNDEHDDLEWLPVCEALDWTYYADSWADAHEEDKQHHLYESLLDNDIIAMRYNNVDYVLAYAASGDNRRSSIVTVTRAEYTPDPKASGNPVPHLILDKDSANVLKVFSASHLRHPVAAVIDDCVISILWFHAPMSSEVYLPGKFSTPTVSNIVNEFNAF